MLDYLHVYPAYGVTYPSIDMAEEAWEKGVDFKIVRGPYCSIRDEGDFQTFGEHDGVAIHRDWSGAPARYREFDHD